MNNDRDIISKIRRLLALADEARNDNEHERATALRQANALMDRHGVQILELGDDDELGPRGQSACATGSARWKTMVFMAVGKLYGCNVYRTTGKLGDTVIIGRQHYRNVVLDMGAWLISSIDREARLHQYRGRKFTGGFRKGGAVGLSRTADAILKQRAQGDTVKQPGQSLVLVDHFRNEIAANSAWLDSQGVKLRTNSGGRVDPAGYHAGQQYGAALNLSDQLGGGRKHLTNTR